MVNLVLGGVGRPGLEPGTNALKGQRGGPPRFGMGRQGSARGSARSFSGPEPQIRPQQPEPASVSIARYSGTGPVESRRVGMSKVSKKCPSRHSLGWRKASIYEGAGSRIRTDDLLITNQSLSQEPVSRSRRLTETHYKAAKMLRTERDLCRAAAAKSLPRQVPKSKESLEVLGNNR
jgi:hypothetical protein